jgi:hypothetical protein
VEVQERLKWEQGSNIDGSISPYFITRGNYTISKTHHGEGRVLYSLYRGSQLLGVFKTAGEAKKVAGDI